MNVKIIATKTCSHGKILQRELSELGILFDVVFIEENPDVVEIYNIRQTPNILVNNEIVFRGQPSMHELRQFFSKS